jgi:hypothetical protein
VRSGRSEWCGRSGGCRGQGGGQRYGCDGAGRADGGEETGEPCEPAAPGDVCHDLTNAVGGGTLRRPAAGNDFALRPARLVPWEAIGDTALDCVIICTHHSRSRGRLCWRRRLVRSMAPHC